MTAFSSPLKDEQGERKEQHQLSLCLERQGAEKGEQPIEKKIMELGGPDISKHIFKMVVDYMKLIVRDVKKPKLAVNTTTVSGD